MDHKDLIPVYSGTKKAALEASNDNVREGGADKARPTPADGAAPLPRLIAKTAAMKAQPG